MVYNPLTGLSRPVFKNNNVGRFSFSVNGRLAFSTINEHNLDIYVPDNLTTDISLSNITKSPDMDDYPLAWSANSKYLAFESYQDEQNRLIEVWNGEIVINITPSDIDSPVDSYYASWSADTKYLAFRAYLNNYSEGLYIWDGTNVFNITPKDLPPPIKIFIPSWSVDGRLAFTVRTKDDLGEIFIWDGKNTVNLSQNPLSGDGGPVWSADGRLAFGSRRDGKDDIFVWDGISFKNNLPDADTFKNIAPSLTYYESFPQWVQNGLVAFVGQSQLDHHVQIYVWDGTHSTNISQNPPMHNGSATWSNNGRWAFSTFFSPQQLIYVRDINNHTILTVDGSSPTWSSDGDLAFCTRTSGGWTLSVWDGKTLRKVVEGREITAKWLSGEGLGCSSG
jgi:hypothetical protein